MVFTIVYILVCQQLVRLQCRSRSFSLVSEHSNACDSQLLWIITKVIPFSWLVQFAYFVYFVGSVWELLNIFFLIFLFILLLIISLNVNKLLAVRFYLFLLYSLYCQFIDNLIFTGRNPISKFTLPGQKNIPMHIYIYLYKHYYFPLKDLNRRPSSTNASFYANYVT